MTSVTDQDFGGYQVHSSALFATNPSVRPMSPILQRLSCLLLQRGHDLQSLANSTASRLLLHDLTHLGKPALPEAPALEVQPPRGWDQLAAGVGAPRRGRLLGPDPEQRLLPQLVPGADDPLGRDAHPGVDAGLRKRLALVVLGCVALQAGAQLPDTEGAEGGLDVAEGAGDE